MKKISDWIYKNRKTLLTIGLVLAFVMFVLMYQWLPFREDDDFYMHGWGTGEYISSLKDIFLFLKAHYLYWGGRIVSHGILQLMFYIGRPYSAILNTVAYFVLAYALSKAVFKKFNLTFFALVSALLFFLSPYREEIILWYTGCANYIWTTMIIFLAALPYMDLLREGKFRLESKYWLMLPLYFLAGWTNENMAPTFILFMVFTTGYEFYKTKKTDPLKIADILVCFAGCCMLMFAPGNFVRTYSSYTSLISTIVFRIHTQIYAWSSWLLIPMLVFALLRYFNYRNNDAGNKLFTYPLLGWYVLSVLIFIGSPTFPQRATSGSFCILLILIADEFRRMMLRNEDNKKFVSVLSVILTFALAAAMFAIAMTELSFLI